MMGAMSGALLNELTVAARLNMLRGLAVDRDGPFSTVRKRGHQTPHGAIAAHGAELMTGIRQRGADPNAAASVPLRQRFTLAVNRAIEPLKFLIGLSCRKCDTAPHRGRDRSR